MARTKKPELITIFQKGTEFFNSVTDTFNGAKDLVNAFKINLGYKETYTYGTNNYTKRDELDVKESSYRFMKLNPGCGALSVKSRFRELVKDKRPDLVESDNTKWFVALQVARDTLLKYEK